MCTCLVCVVDLGRALMLGWAGFVVACFVHWGIATQTTTIGHFDSISALPLGSPLKPMFVGLLVWCVKLSRTWLLQIAIIVHNLHAL